MLAAHRINFPVERRDRERAARRRQRRALLPAIRRGIVAPDRSDRFALGEDAGEAADDIDFAVDDGDAVVVHRLGNGRGLLPLIPRRVVDLDEDARHLVGAVAAHDVNRLPQRGDPGLLARLGHRAGETPHAALGQSGAFFRRGAGAAEAEPEGQHDERFNGQIHGASPYRCARTDERESCAREKSSQSIRRVSTAG
jgi:hypothetical protein